jgi:hypothetical protein
MLGEVTNNDNDDPGTHEDPIVHVPADLRRNERASDQGGRLRPFERHDISDAGSPPDNDYPGRDEASAAEDPSNPARSLPEEHFDSHGEADHQRPISP